jgi:purine-nucleoside phosphorylase
VTVVEPLVAAADAAHVLAERTGITHHEVAVVLGSGWLDAVAALGSPDYDLAVTELPGFVPPTVAGHAGRIQSLEVYGRRVLALLGRTHLYEGRGVEAVVHGVRVAVAAGCQVVILTNACGGLRAGLAIGDAVVISDHLNLSWQGPLHGANFVDLSDLYSPRLRAVVHDVDQSLTEGVYAMFRGPQYETPAEVRMAAALGADLVGMSTVLEAIAARAAGAEVLGLSLVANLAAGITGQPLAHQEVLDAGRAAAARMGELLGKVIERL